MWTALLTPSLAEAGIDLMAAGNRAAAIAFAFTRVQRIGYVKKVFCSCVD